MDVVLPAAAAVVTVVVIYLAAERVLASKALGALAAAFFIATPLLWAQFRDAPASIFPLLATSGWLFAVTRIEPGRTVGWVALAGLALGAGVHATPAAVVMMPVYALLTMAVFACGRRMSLRQISVFSSAFALAAAPLAWTLFGPQDQFRRTVNALRLYDADRFNILQGGREMTSWVGLTARSEAYYNYFSPSFLFLSGGVLLPPLLVLIPIGLYQLIEKSVPAARLVLAGFLAAPVAAALTADQPIPRRILFITPFAAIVAARGAQKILSWLRQLSHSTASGRRGGMPAASQNNKDTP